MVITFQTGRYKDAKESACEGDNIPSDLLLNSENEENEKRIIEAPEYVREHLSSHKDSPGPSSETPKQPASSHLGNFALSFVGFFLS